MPFPIVAGIQAGISLLAPALKNQFGYKDVTKYDPQTTFSGNFGTAGYGSGSSAGYSYDKNEYQTRETTGFGKALDIIAPTLNTGLAVADVAGAFNVDPANQAARQANRAAKKNDSISMFRKGGVVENKFIQPSQIVQDETAVNIDAGIISPVSTNYSFNNHSIDTANEYFGNPDNNLMIVPQRYTDEIYERDNTSFQGGGFVAGISRLNGPSHKQGGIPMNLNGKEVEVEGGEYKLDLDNGDKVILNKEQYASYKNGVPLSEIIKTMPENNKIAANGAYISSPEVYDYLVGTKGLSHNKAVGILNNIMAESEFEYGVEESADIKDGLKNTNKKGLGLFQYSEISRQEKFLNTVPDWATNWKAQIDYVIDKDPMTRQYLDQTFDSPEAASRNWTTKWEIPENAKTKAEERLQYTSGYDQLNLSEGYSQNAGISRDSFNPFTPTFPGLQESLDKDLTAPVSSSVTTTPYPFATETTSPALNAFGERNLPGAGYGLLDNPSLQSTVPSLNEVEPVEYNSFSPPLAKKEEVDFFDQYEQNLKRDMILGAGANLGGIISNVGDLRYNESQPYPETVPQVSTRNIGYNFVSPKRAFAEVDKATSTANRYAKNVGRPELVTSNLSRKLDAIEGISDNVNKTNAQMSLGVDSANREAQIKTDSLNTGIHQFNIGTKAAEENRRTAARSKLRENIYAGMNTLVTGLGQMGQNKFQAGIMRELNEQGKLSSFF